MDDDVAAKKKVKKVKTVVAEDAAPPAKKKKKKKKKKEKVMEVEMEAAAPVKEEEATTTKKKKKKKAAEGAEDAEAPTKKTKKETKKQTADPAFAGEKTKKREAVDVDGPASKRAKPIVCNDDDKEVSSVEAKLAAARSSKKNKAQHSKNPTGCTRLFVGNLPWSIDDAGLAAVLGVESLAAVKYLTDRDTKKFYGTAFVEVADVDLAAEAVATKNGSTCEGRTIKISYSPPKTGDVWPPVKQASRAGQARERTPRPEGGTTKLFLGNVAYEADDDDIKTLFATAAGPDGPKSLRWLTNKDTGEFRGCGYCEFWTADAADAAVKLDGSIVKGRPIRVDYTEAAKY